MERGTVSLTNLELKALHNMAIEHGCTKEDLIEKLNPVEGAENHQEYVVQISEDDAEIVLDCMPAPNEQSDPNLSSSRIKIQEFITKCRFTNL